MAKETKKQADEADGPNGSELVRVKANPRLFPICKGQIVVNNRVVPTTGVEVTRAEYEVLRNVDYMGVQAVVLDD